MAWPGGMEAGDLNTDPQSIIGAMAQVELPRQLA
jgi:hypothetical protein